MLILVLWEPVWSMPKLFLFFWGIVSTKSTAAVTQACPISCGMRRQIGRCWYHREAVCLSSSLSGSCTDCQKCSWAHTCTSILLCKQESCHFQVPAAACISSNTLHDFVSVFLSLKPRRKKDSSDTAPQCLSQHSRSVVVLLVHTSSPLWKYGGRSDIFEVCSNWRISLKILWSFCKPGKTKTLFFQPWEEKNPPLKYSKKKGQNGKSQKMTQCLVLYLLHAKWGVAEEIRYCQGLNAGTCSMSMLN